MPHSIARGRVLAATFAAAAAAVLLQSGGAVAADIPTRPEYAATAAPALSLTADPPQVATGRSTVLSGRLTDPSTGSGLPGEPVNLEALASDGSWVEVAALTTDAKGAVSSVQTPASTTGYRLRATDPGPDQEVASPLVQVAVRTLTGLLDRTAVRAGHEVAVRGVLAADAGSPLRLERRSDGAWRAAGRTRTAPDGSYTFTLMPTEPGFSRWRVVRDAGAGWSRSVARLPLLDAYLLHTFSVTTRGDARSDLAEFRAAVAATYADPRGWLRAHHRFRMVRSGGAFTVVLSQAQMLPGFSGVCSSTYSCRVGRYVIINDTRWRHGSPYFPGDLPTYRRMLVNHETGHWLGLGHAYCPRHGAPAPVMQQQSKGMQGCRVNPWPLSREVRAVS